MAGASLPSRLATILYAHASRDYWCRTSRSIAFPFAFFTSHRIDCSGDKKLAHVESRIRAGVLEHGTVQLLCETGVGERLKSQGMRHEGINLGFSGRLHRINFAELTGKAITVYGQHEVLKDLIAARINCGGQILFEVADVSTDALSTDRPRVRFRYQGELCALTADWLAGCDGSHGVSRASVPPAALRIFETTYPFGWLGILAEAAPS
jgi:p-hydroxybenzoate 3-monooxygenase